MEKIGLDENLGSVDSGRVLEWASSGKSRQALADLHSKYYPKIRAFIASRVGSSEDAEDLAQDVFIELYRNDGWYDRVEDPETYIFGIARNLIRQYYRKRAKSARTIPIQEIGPLTDGGHGRRQHPDAANRMEKQELTESIEFVLAKLRPKARQALKLRLVDGLSPKEAAGKAGCSVNSFYQRVYLAMSALAKLGIADLDVEPPVSKRRTPSKKK